MTHDLTRPVASEVMGDGVSWEMIEWAVARGSSAGMPPVPPPPTAQTRPCGAPPTAPACTALPRTASVQSDVYAENAEDTGSGNGAPTERKTSFKRKTSLGGDTLRESSQEGARGTAASEQETGKA